MPPTKLTPTMRRELTLRALRGESGYALAEEYGTTHQYVYRLRDAAEREAWDRLERAREELEFRREVWEMSGGGEA